MSNCKTELTYVYSSPCISYLRELIETLDSTFSIKDKLDNMFWYGVFCNAETYAYYKYYTRCNEPVPDLLANENASLSAKLSYVKDIINQVLKGEIEKPGWMFYVEETEAFNKFEDSPSTFLYLIPKDEKYTKFGKALTNFLYSPNLLMTLRN
jgi:hypothetical protein